MSSHGGLIDDGAVVGTGFRSKEETVMTIKLMVMLLGSTEIDEDGEAIDGGRHG